MKLNRIEKSNEQVENKPCIKQGIVRRVCSECEKPNIYCKGMCQACYSKMQRNTEKGKERMKAYNLSAGKESQRKYRERKKANKPPKPPKPICECGKPSIAKGLCHACYHKYYARKKYVRKERKERKDKPNVSLIFSTVLSEVKKGFTIEMACKNANVNRRSFYHHISPIQKAELISCKILMTNFKLIHKEDKQNETTENS